MASVEERCIAEKEGTKKGTRRVEAGANTDIEGVKVPTETSSTEHTGHLAVSIAARMAGGRLTGIVKRPGEAARAGPDRKTGREATVKSLAAGEL